MKLARTIAFIFLMWGCNNSASDNNKSETSKTDSLMHEVMKGHNFTMGKMEKMNKTQRRVQQIIDSISRLSPGKRKNAERYREQLGSVLNRLGAANAAMDTWMNQFNMDSLQNNAEERTKYLESEKIKILSVKDSMINSLRDADSLLKKD
ncbi:MAG TPA: hypothetical protein VGI82_13045 [Chitinophagaceae bacterium]